MSKIKAIMVVHIYGRRIDMDLVHSYAKAHGLYVIEDLAEAHGVRPHLETHAVCHSFYKNKIVAGEEGGAVWFLDSEHAALARQLRSLGFTDAHDFTHAPRGHNYRMSNAHAHLIIDSLRQVGQNVAERRRMEAAYDRACPVEWRMPPRDAPWVYDVRIPGMTHEVQNRVVAVLQEAGVAARHAFKPMSTQEEWRGCKVGERALLASREVIYLPLTKTTGDLDLYAQLALSILKSALVK